MRSSWTRERKIYLAAGVVACLVGVLLIAFSL
jgi:type II secretory pathway component PulM